jgi:WhiB family redox-sensing transcriptional regulator
LTEQLTARIGADWVSAVAEQDCRTQERQHARRVQPPTARQQALTRLELELIPTRPTPYEPWLEPMTRACREQNQRLFLAGLTTRTAA